MNDSDEDAIGDGYSVEDEEFPVCTCPDWDMRSPRRFDPDCELHPPIFDLP